MNKSILKCLAVTTLLFVFTACKKEGETLKETENFKGVIIVNEGGFNKSNGSIGLFKPGSSEYKDAFMSANARPLGDVVQSITKIGDQFYIVVNNSNKIVVVNSGNFKAENEINYSSPRYVLRINDNKAFVSSLYSNSIAVLSTSSKTISGQININHSGETMSYMDSMVYISASGNKIMVVDAFAEKLVDSIPAGKGLGRIVNVGADKIAVLCTGEVDFTSGNVLQNGKVLFIDDDSARVVRTVDLPTGNYGGSMVYNSNNSMIYVTLGGNQIWQISPVTGELKLYITLLAGENAYGISADPLNGDIYITDAGNYSSPGKVYIYDKTGKRLKQFTAGIVPNAAFFNY